jgi:hypothetical protein
VNTGAVEINSSAIHRPLLQYRKEEKEEAYV